MERDWKAPPLPPGLYVTAVTLGNARDITLRALDILAAADLVICEDTRVTRKLCTVHNISPRAMTAYHEHSGEDVRERLIRRLSQEGISAALVSDAGTPLISDPGYKLVRAARVAGVAVYTAPGPCALSAAVSVSAAPSDQVSFVGFLPSKSAARRSRLHQAMGAGETTLVAYESPRRLSAMLYDVEALFPGVTVSVCRELTKMHEEVYIGSAIEAAKRYENPERARGECVVLVHPPASCGAVSVGAQSVESKAKDALRLHMQTMRVKDAVRFVREETGLPSKTLYAWALALHDEEGRSLDIATKDPP